jgi:hypothetical protein
MRAVRLANGQLNFDILMGLPLYEKMGYETVELDRVWLPPSN